MRRPPVVILAGLVGALLLGLNAAWGGEVAQAPEQPAAAAQALTPSLGGVELSSQDPAAHLSYASILFYKGRRMLGAGATAEGEAIFREIEGELHTALKLADQDQDASGRRLLQSQCAFMLGDIRYFVFHDPLTATEFYREALAYFPEHDGASEALKRLTPEPPAQPK